MDEEGDTRHWTDDNNQPTEKEITRSGLKLDSRTVEYIGSEISLPYLDMLPDGAAPQPQASLLPQPQAQGISSLSQSLSIFIWRIKNESEMKLWNGTLSLSLLWNGTLSLSLFLSLFKTLSVIACCFCLTLVDKFINIYPFFGFIRWCWCWWDTNNCLLVLVLVSFGEIQLIGFIWLALVLWLGPMGHWGLSVELEGGWGHGAGVNAHGVCGCLLVQQCN